jgi:hypothetical protein
MKVVVELVVVIMDFFFNEKWACVGVSRFGGESKQQNAQGMETSQAHMKFVSNP